MEDECYDINNVQVQLTMIIKLQQLQREQLPAMTYQNLEDYLTQYLWKRKIPRSLHTAANDILSITATDLIRFLSQQAIVESRRKNLSDFSDVIGGNETHE
jgi:hypothetical protein